MTPADDTPPTTLPADQRSPASANEQPTLPDLSPPTDLNEPPALPISPIPPAASETEVALEYEQIVIDPDVHARVRVPEAKVEEYAELMRLGVKFPPVVVYHQADTQQYLLADGFLTLAARQKVGLRNAAAVVRPGTRRDAMIHAVIANGAHGLPMTNREKRRAVTRLLADAEWASKSDGDIAAACAVTARFVNGMRRELTQNGSMSASATRRYTTRHGTPAVMDTSKIGKSPRKPSKGGKSTGVVRVGSSTFNVNMAAGEVVVASKQIAQALPKVFSPGKTYVILEVIAAAAAMTSATTSQPSSRSASPSAAASSGSRSARSSTRARARTRR
jgi:hypothetical protein